MGGIYYHYCYGPPQPLADYSMSRIMMVNNHEGFLPYDEVDGLPGQVARCLSCLEKCLKVPPFLAPISRGNGIVCGHVVCAF